MVTKPQNNDARPLSSAEALRLVEEHARVQQSRLAGATDAGEDVLHYLAENGEVATRQAVAANPAASAESNALLAEDADSEVRAALAQKIGRLFPGLLSAEQEQLRDLTISTLEKLARDEVVMVRAILAEEIKGHDCVPKHVVKQLAGDEDPSVSVPVLECSPLLEDRDLIEIVVASRASAVLSAVARRKQVSEDVSDAVAATLDIAAVSALLANTDATIRTKTLDRIISNAADIAEWHQSLVLRADLSQSAIRRLAKFVAAALIDSLASREGLDDGTRKDLTCKYETRKRAEEDAEAVAFEEACKTGRLNEEFVAGAVEHYCRDTVIRALAVLAKVDEVTVRRILESRSGKAVSALVWRAGLSMRISLKLQTQVMRLSTPEMLPARGGVGYPLSEDEMRMHLGLFGIS